MKNTKPALKGPYKGKVINKCVPDPSKKKALACKKPGMVLAKSKKDGQERLRREVEEGGQEDVPPRLFRVRRQVREDAENHTGSEPLRVDDDPARHGCPVVFDEIEP